MQADQEARSYVVRKLEHLGAQSSQHYVELLGATPAGKTIAGLTPWAFLLTPERSQQYCSEAAGYPVLPFAQAVGEDMMACFKCESGSAPALPVIVINPWAEDKADAVLAELPDFDAWLIYAGEVARTVKAGESEEAGGE